MIIACLLLKQGIKDSPNEALALFAQRRTCSKKENETKNTKTQRVSSMHELNELMNRSFTDPICVLLQFLAYTRAQAQAYSSPAVSGDSC